MLPRLDISVVFVPLVREKAMKISSTFLINAANMALVASVDGVGGGGPCQSGLSIVRALMEQEKEGKMRSRSRSSNIRVLRQNLA